MMIYSIFFALCLLGIQADKLMPKYRKECLLKSKASENDIMKLKTGVFPPSTPELKEYAKCMLSVRGILIHDNIFNREPIIDGLGEKRQEQIQRLENCLEKKGLELRNDDAYEFVKCYYNKNKIKKALL